jgi:uncharacterized SAM-binding protein YcdF (DUF218 family)
MPSAAESSESLQRAAERVLAYLGETDPLPTPERGDAPATDAIIGFGVFDLNLPRFCGDLFMAGVAPMIIFTGGIGAGTGDLGGPEADAWRAALRTSHPTVPDRNVILENRSANTAENIQFTATLLARDYPDLAFGAGIRRVTIVASPSRLRRVALTLKQLQPQLRVIRRLPSVDFALERELYERNGVNYLAHLCGELDRIIEYPNRGWIAAEPLPPAISAAHAVLRRTSESKDAR